MIIVTATNRLELGPLNWLSHGVVGQIKERLTFPNLALIVLYTTERRIWLLIPSWSAWRRFTGPITRITEALTILLRRRG